MCAAQVLIFTAFIDRPMSFLARVCRPAAVVNSVRRAGDPAVWSLVNAILLAGASQAQTNPPLHLPPIVVTAESEHDALVHPPFLAPVEGTKINAGKKTSVLDLDDLPQISNNNYRQALTKTPGLLLSEETSPLVSLGYRGLSPHRAQFTQVLKDGVPIHADQFGYPEAYYTPPLDTVDRLEFVRGGASLMYGPQPGGALNYVTHRPRTDTEWAAHSQHLFGSDDLYSTFNSVDGTVGRLGYYAYYNHRQTAGFRAANSDVDLDTGSVSLVLDGTSNSRWIFTFDGYAEAHGEPGGLTLATGPNTVNYDTDRNATSRFYDRFELERYFATLAWEWDLSLDTSLTVTGWGGYYSRFSQRQRGGGFGTLPTGPAADSNTIELQEFYTQGLETRLRHDYALGGRTQTLTAGLQLYHTDSPRIDQRGVSAGATAGAVRSASERSIFYAPVFVENRLVLGDLSITPGVRLESFRQTAEETLNLDKAAVGTPLGDKSQTDFVPLVGLGLEYGFASGGLTPYANVSQAYRPIVFTEAVPTGGNTVVNDDLAAGESWQYEVGLRGQPATYAYWDTSLFWLDFDNQIGAVGNTVQNLGRSRHRGWEAAGEVELLGLADAVRGGTGEAGKHQVSLHANVMLLDAEITGSATPTLMGKTPQYAPDHVLRIGTIYRWQNRAKVALLGSFLDDHYADDANTANRLVPAYMVWDLTFEVKMFRDQVSLLAGINNLFNEDYYARIRPDGIDPAYGRNYYAGLSLRF